MTRSLVISEILNKTHDFSFSTSTRWISSDQFSGHTHFQRGPVFHHRSQFPQLLFFCCDVINLIVISVDMEMKEHTFFLKAEMPTKSARKLYKPFANERSLLKKREYVIQTGFSRARFFFRLLLSPLQLRFVGSLRFVSECTQAAQRQSKAQKYQVHTFSHDPFFACSAIVCAVYVIFVVVVSFMQLLLCFNSSVFHVERFHHVLSYAHILINENNCT